MTASSRFEAAAQAARDGRIYTVNADGRGLFQVTHIDDIEFNGDWRRTRSTPETTRGPAIAAGR